MRCAHRIKYQFIQVLKFKAEKDEKKSKNTVKYLIVRRSVNLIDYRTFLMTIDNF